LPVPHDFDFEFQALVLLGHGTQFHVWFLYDDGTEDLLQRWYFDIAPFRAGVAKPKTAKAPLWRSGAGKLALYE
jgi:hypothetical protein